jgi:PAS domain S-box-containing protein
LIKENTLYEPIYLNTPVAYQALDKDGCILDVNPEWCKKTGYTKKQVIGKPFKDFLIPEDRKSFDNAFQLLINTGQSETNIIHIEKKNKEIMTVEYHGCTNEDPHGVSLHTNCFLYDISNYVESKKQLERNQELENLRAEIWKTAALLENEQELIQSLLDKCGPVLGSENISFMPYNESAKNLVVEQIWRKDAEDIGIGDVVPGWIFKRFLGKPYVYQSFDDLPLFIKPVLIPFQKKYGTKSTLVIPYGDSQKPRGYLSSQTYTYNKRYNDSEISLFIELSKIIFLKSNQLQNTKALIESQKRFKNLTEQATEGLVIHKNGVIQDINPAAEKMFNIKREQVLQGSIFDFVHPKHHEMLIRRLKNKENIPVEVELTGDKGRIIHAEVSTRDSVSEDDELRVVTIQNITEKKIAEKNLLKLSSIVEQSPISIVITDLEGNIEYVNKKFTDTVGYKTESIIGKNPNIISSGYTSKEEYKELWDTVLSGKVWTGELKNKKKDGSFYWEHATIAPIMDKSGDIINLAGLKVDITEKKKAEEELQRSQEELKASLQAKDKLFSVISHDLRSPFNAILGFSDLIVEKTEKEGLKELHEFSTYLNQAAHRSYNLLINLLNWSRIQTGKIKFNPHTFNLSESIENVLKLNKGDADEKAITIDTTGPENIEVYADQNMIETILRNVLSNAIKFTPKAGSVKLHYNKDDTSFNITVSDTGVGISEENIEKLFHSESFITTKGTEKESGTGLGLILTKEFIDFHSGNIKVDSEEGKGTSISIEIPQ